MPPTLSQEAAAVDECTDTPEELLAPAVEKLALPAATCAELLAIGGCELEVVKDLCAKSCDACGGKQSASHLAFSKHIPHIISLSPSRRDGTEAARKVPRLIDNLDLRMGGKPSTRSTRRLDLVACLWLIAR